MAMVAGGIAGALLILAVLDAAESLSNKKNRLF
jgi:hypothetical protein